MKKLNIYLLTLVVFVLGSCQDFLETESYTDGTEENFYQTPGDAFKALVGCYDGLQQVTGDYFQFPLASEILSDNAFGAGGPDDRSNRLVDEFDKNKDGNQDVFESNWSDYYAAIYRCNMLINKLDQIDWGTDEALRTTYESEARFLRAYFYFDMVRLWGNIPLLTEPSSENVPQSDPDDVYELIASDLKFAADNMEAVSYDSQPVAEFGRVTKWAAESLLARVYLYYTGYYGKPDLVGLVTQDQALAYVEDVISNSGHGLVEDFATLWPAASMGDYAGERNEEIVFSIRYTYTSDYNGNTDGNHWMVMYGIRGLSDYPYGQGWGAGTINPKLWNAFDDDDTRKVASITSIDDEEIPYTDKQLSDMIDYTGYFNKKYSPLVNEEGQALPETEEIGAVNFMLGQFQDYFSIRYADVLLMAAELGSSNAQSYYNQVRERAFKENFVEQTITPERIMEERRLEFVGEGIRYWDLMRQGIDVAANTIAESVTVLNQGNSVTKTISKDLILATKGLQQIPNNQITLSNNVLKQNAGW